MWLLYLKNHIYDLPYVALGYIACSSIKLVLSKKDSNNGN